jgi:hypothetical protein
MWMDGSLLQGAGEGMVGAPGSLKSLSFPPVSLLSRLIPLVYPLLLSIPYPAQVPSPRAWAVTVSVLTVGQVGAREGGESMTDEGLDEDEGER